MTAVPAISASPELVRRREALQAELEALEREAAELPAQIDGAIDSGDSATALRLERRRLPEVRARLATVAPQLAAVVEEEQRARAAALSVAQQRARDAVDQELSLADPAVVDAALRFVRQCRAQRATLERRAEIEVAITGRPDAGRAIVAARNAGGVVQALDVVAAWMARDPAVSPPRRDQCEPFVDPIGRLVLRFYDVFFDDK